MQDTELFLSLAEIAGVFVGFGALISVRSGGASEAHEVTYIRWVVSIAIWVVIAALAPVIISRYDITGHDLWMACSLVALVLFAVMYTVNGRAPEHREDAAAILATAPRVLLVVGAGSTIWLPAASLALALALVVLGLFPDREQALYLTAVGLGLFMGAIGLFAMVFSQRRPAAPPDGVGLTAPGGSST
jgi:uncharacterized membrane protein YozB (DUF420 family)